MNDPYNCLNKSTGPFFEILSGSHFLGRSARETGKKCQKWAKMDQFLPKKWQPVKITKNGLVTLLRQL